MALCVMKINPCEGLSKWQYFLLVVRGLQGFSCFLGTMWSLTMIPLSISVLIFNTSPFWVSIMGFCCNNEGFAWLDVAVMGICLACVIGIALTSP